MRLQSVGDRTESWIRRLNWTDDPSKMVIGSSARRPGIPEPRAAEPLSSIFPWGNYLTTALLAPTAVAPATDALERACLCARTAADNKARDVVVLDMRGVTPIFDFLVLTTGGSR